ncbi:MAG: energy transducer TonB [Thermodesulfobacteriota bacterium]|nr:energy transducer TonB [Thermodesulfobacteriota bacterium]
MADTEHHNPYLDDITSYKRLRWSGAVIAALGLNLLLFLLMPRLMHHSPAPPVIEKIVPHVQVARVHRPGHEKKRVVRRPAPPPEPPPEVRQQSVPDRPVKPELTMPFDINPHLPSGPNTLDLPPLEAEPVAPAGMDIFSETDLDAPLTVLVQAPPSYPLRARRLGIEGRVTVSFIVNESGHVENIQILSADPENVFENSVRQCVSQWRFKPATVDGTPVKVRRVMPIKFKLE